MLYYRFRSPSELSFKELLYSEMYFASQEECNDPFDSKSFYEFPPDRQRWKNLFELAFGRLGNIVPSMAETAADEIVKKGGITFDEAMFTDYVDLFRVAANIEDEVFLNAAANGVLRALGLYKPQPSYFVSFSKQCDEPLMWAHYAQRHEGHCLVFRAIDGALQQNPLTKKRATRRSTPNSFSPTMSFSTPERFHFRDIEYKEAVEHLNAFERFPASVAMRQLSEEERVALVAKQDSQCFQKHESWGYEEEARITLRAPMPWLCGDRFEYSPQERLFQYEPSQLVGVILGARMSEPNKQRIVQILEERAHLIARLCNYKRISFDFLLQRARLSTRGRQIDIIPERFIGIKPTKREDEQFDGMLRHWESGHGIEFDGNRATSVRV